MKRGTAYDGLGWTGMWLALGSVVMSVVVLVGAAVLLAESDVATEVAMTITFLLGLIVLVAVIGMLVIGFRSVGLSTNKQALGLPEGSIRALLALILVLAFVFTSIYLVERVFLQEGPGPEAAQNVALSIVSIFGTLVTAAMAFYFGTNAVKSGAAVTAAVVQPSRPPTATTKGNEPPSGGKVTVVGFVNPRGRETQWLFEYGETTDYGKATGLEVIGAGEKDVLVKAELDHPGPKPLNVRVVALNDAGRARGANHEVPPPTEEQAAPVVDTPPPDVVVEGDVHVGGDVLVHGEDQTAETEAEVVEAAPDDDEFEDEETLEDSSVDDLEPEAWEDEVDDFEEGVGAAEDEMAEKEAEITAAEDEPPPPPKEG